MDQRISFFGAHEPVFRYSGAGICRSLDLMVVLGVRGRQDFHDERWYTIDATLIDDPEVIFPNPVR